MHIFNDNVIMTSNFFRHILSQIWHYPIRCRIIKASALELMINLSYSPYIFPSSDNIIFRRPHGGYMANASWKLCSISGLHTPSASLPSSSSPMSSSSGSAFGPDWLFGAGAGGSKLPHVVDMIEGAWRILQKTIDLSRGVRFPTIWHFDKCRLGRVSAAFF